MNEADAIVVGKNLYTFRDNGGFIDLARRIVVVEKRRILLNVRVDVSAVSAFSADKRSLDWRRSRTFAEDVHKCRRDFLGRTEDAVLCILRPQIHTRRIQIRAFARTYCRFRTVRASEE